MPAMPTQQQKPMMSGLPPVLTSLTMFVFSPTAHMAITIRNLLSVLLSVLSGVNTLADTPALTHTVVITDASRK